MVKYLEILLRMANEPFAIDRVKLGAIVEFILFKADGGMLTHAEIEARTIGERRARDIAQAPGSVGVIPIHGLIMPRVANLNVSEQGVGLDALAVTFRSAMANDNLKAIILDIDSPGGQTGGLDEFASEMFEARGTKPIIAQVNSLAASAAYYIAAQADEIVASPSGRAGSIGVYAIHDDISEMLAKKGINRTLISSSKNKTLANPFGPLSEEARDKIMKDVQFATDQFVAAVARGRGVSQKFVNENMGQGDTFNPPELVKNKMADRIAPFRETLARFGASVSPAKATQASLARTQLALGRVPAKQDFEAFLREYGGASKSFAASLASGIAEPGRSESDPVDPRRESARRSGNVSTETINALRDVLAKAKHEV